WSWIQARLSQLITSPGFTPYIKRAMWTKQSGLRRELFRRVQISRALWTRSDGSISRRDYMVQPWSSYKRLSTLTAPLLRTQTEHRAQPILSIWAWLLKQKVTKREPDISWKRHCAWERKPRLPIQTKRGKLFPLCKVMSNRGVSHE